MVRGLRASFAVGENAPKDCDQPIEFDRLGVELVASRRERLFALTGERMRGQGDDGDVAGLRTALEPPRGLPAIDIGHFEIHQDDVGTFAERHRAAPLAVLRRQHLEIAEQLESHLEHEDVVVVVFHVKYFGHDAASISLLTGGLLCTNRRMRSTRSAGRNLSLTSTNWTPAFNRSRSLASRSSEVMTMTGMSRQPTSFCKAATTAKPAILRHHQIEQDHVRLALLDTFERLATVLGLSHSPLRTLEPSAHPLALNRVVLHHQDARGWHVCPKPANQPMQPFAVDWLGEIARRAEGNAAAVLIHDRDHDDRNVGELSVLPQSG